jgi:hypothetical protein
MSLITLAISTFKTMLTQTTLIQTTLIKAMLVQTMLIKTVLIVHHIPKISILYGSVPL